MYPRHVSSTCALGLYPRYLPLFFTLGPRLITFVSVLVIYPRPPPSESTVSLSPQYQSSVSYPAFYPRPPHLYPRSLPSATSLSIYRQSQPSVSALGLYPRPPPWPRRSASILGLRPQSTLGLPPPLLPTFPLDLYPRHSPSVSTLGLSPRLQQPASTLRFCPRPPPSVSALHIYPQPSVSCPNICHWPVPSACTFGLCPRSLPSAYALVLYHRYLPSVSTLGIDHRSKSSASTFGHHPGSVLGSLPQSAPVTNSTLVHDPRPKLSASTLSVCPLQLPSTLGPRVRPGSALRFWLCTRRACVVCTLSVFNNYLLKPCRHCSCSGVIFVEM